MFCVCFFFLTNFDPVLIGSMNIKPVDKREPDIMVSHQFESYNSAIEGDEQ